MKFTPLYIFLLFLSKVSFGSGITGSSGNELLYTYLLLMGLFLVPLGIDHSIKWFVKKWKERQIEKRYKDFENLI